LSKVTIFNQVRNSGSILRRIPKNPQVVHGALRKACEIANRNSNILWPDDFSLADRDPSGNLV
jgi:hypothetical protein